MSQNASLKYQLFGVGFQLESMNHRVQSMMHKVDSRTEDTTMIDSPLKESNQMMVMQLLTVQKELTSKNKEIKMLKGQLAQSYMYQSIQIDW